MAATASVTHDQLLPPGSEQPSPGGMYSFRVLGPCCRLFDREELPWPCCRLAWHSKEPSWRRVGKRFVPDLAARRSPSYAVELLQPGSRPTATVLTLFSHTFSRELQEWWYSRHPRSMEPDNCEPEMTVNPLMDEPPSEGSTGQSLGGDQK